MTGLLDSKRRGEWQHARVRGGSWGVRQFLFYNFSWKLVRLCLIIMVIKLRGLIFLLFLGLFALLCWQLRSSERFVVMIADCVGDDSGY